jgi:hypothetical protein
MSSFFLIRVEHKEFLERNFFSLPQMIIPNHAHDDMVYGVRNSHHYEPKDAHGGVREK